MTFFLSNTVKSAVVRLSLLTTLLVPSVAAAQVYGGSGLESGLGLLSGIGGISAASTVQEIVLAIIAFILDIALLLAVLAIIIAGVYLIVSNGDEGNKDKAKKIITYVVIGIIVILFARVIVALVVSIFE
ncbi:MAG: hypothetical protein ABL890_00365 [Candidatus Peribacteraceae bacterium]